MVRYIYIIVAFFLALFAVGCGGTNEKQVGDNDMPGRTIIETGELAAVKSESFFLRRFGNNGDNKIIGMLEHGEFVRPGDSLIQLDPTNIRKRIVELETDLENQMAALEKIQFDRANKDNEIEAAIRSEEASFALSKLQLEASRYEPDLSREITELQFRQAEITRAKEQKRREYNKILGDYDYRIQQLTVAQLQKRIKLNYELLPQLTIRSNIAGVFQRGDNRRVWPRVPLKVGDEVYEGQRLASVPDLSYMKVNTTVNETDFLKIKVGQKVNVRLDALPNVIFDGRISYVGRLCRPKDYNSKQKVFDVEVEVLDSDERLKPGMTVSCEYLLK